MGQGAIIDADTFAMWRFDEAAGNVGAVAAVDSAPGGRDLTPNTSGSGNFLRSSPGLITDLPAAWHGAELTPWWQRSTDNAFRAMLQGSWTIEFWVLWAQKGSYHNTICHTHATANPKPTIQDHDLMLVTFRQGDGKIIGSWTEATSHTWQGNYSTGSVELGVRTHVAIRKKVELDLSVTLSYFFDGVLDSTFTAIENVDQDPATGSNGQFRIGCYAENADSPFAGILDDIRLSSIARSDAEILETYTRGVSGGGGGAAPVVTLVSPPDASQIQATTPIVLDVTDDTDSFRRIILTARYRGLGLEEVVHNGDRFGDAFQGSRCTRSRIADGYRYSVVRDNGGWPGADLEFFAAAIDTSGNENS